ncbi:MAG TPA: hypothetical protein VN181_03935, partial [Thermoanaerobaculia bacterium]|nr:hypothetical protein [Thermoanaerobaculia bacterium]
MTIRRQEILLSLSYSLWGLAIAISLSDVFARPAPPGQLPGLAKDIGIDAHAPMRFFLFLIFITIAMPFFVRPLLRRLEDAQPWARRTAMLAPVASMWFTLITHAPLYAIIPTALTLVACVLLRNYRAEFTRYDLILLPTWLAVVFAMIDILPQYNADRAALITAMGVLAMRLALVRIPSPLPPALAFVASPLAFIPMTGFFARDQRYFGWHALAIAVITPPILRIVLKNRKRVLRALAFVIYPIFVYAYTNATTLETAEGKPRVNMFENAHMLMPAGEMLHGEKLYRDILPAHGMMEDGFFDYLAMRLRGPNITNALRARVTVGSLNSIALYALGCAMTGSAEAGLATFFLGAITGTVAPSTIRFLPAIFTLAMAAHAVRRRNAKWLGYAARGVVISGMFSLDFAFYAAVALLVATLRFRPLKPALRQVAIGIAATGIPFFILLAILGIARDFVVGTLFEVLPLSEVYAMDLFDTPAG